MLKEEKNAVVEVFKRNVSNYVALNDLQEFITSLTYIFWRIKFFLKHSNFVNEYMQCGMKDINNILGKLGDLDKREKINIRQCVSQMHEINLFNIYKYLDELNEEKVVEIIIEDYDMYSKYSSSTPKGICELAYKVLETTKGKEVLDICSYTGNFLSNYAIKNNNYSYSGIEINLESGEVARKRLNAVRVKNDIIQENALIHDVTKKYDKIFCNHPFMLKLDQRVIEKINNSFRILNLERRVSSDWYFVNKVLELLDCNGKAVVVMPNVCLYKLPDEITRKSLIEQNFVECVISLPENVFSNTMIKSSLLILSRNNLKTKFINADGLCSKIRNKKEINVDAIYKEYLSENESDITKIVDIQKIRDLNYSLLAENYLDYEKIEIKNGQKLNDVMLDMFRGYQISSSEIDQMSEKNNFEPCCIINITNINDGEIDEDLITIYPGNGKFNRYILQDKDLLISSKGTINKFVVVEVGNNKRYLPSGNFIVIRLDNSKVNPYYLKMFFESNKGIAIINSIKSGGILPAINVSQFKEIEIPVPPIDEQNDAVMKYFAKKDEIKIATSKLEKLRQTLHDMTDNEF